jgi:GT2 family glycosyltransferase
VDPGIGLSAALNIGFESLSDDVNFVCWLGDDDVLSACFSEKMLAGLESDAQAPFAAGFCEYVDGDGRPFRIQKPKWMSRTGLTIFPVQIAQPATLIRRKVITGNFVDPNLKFAMDLDLWLRLVSKGKPVRVCEITATYRWHSESLSSANVRSALIESSQVRAKYGRPMFRPLQLVLEWLAMAQLRLFGPRFDWDSARQKKDKG